MNFSMCKLFYLNALERNRTLIVPLGRDCSDPLSYEGSRAILYFQKICYNIYNKIINNTNLTLKMFK